MDGHGRRESYGPTGGATLPTSRSAVGVENSSPKLPNVVARSRVLGDEVVDDTLLAALGPCREERNEEDEGVERDPGYAIDGSLGRRKCLF
jgi:hypothetical protein